MGIVKLAFYCLFCTTLAFAQQIRGFAYNPYGTLGGALTVADIVKIPSNIYGHKFAYVSPAEYLGYSSFDLAGGSMLLGFDKSLTVGFAKSFYGLSLSFFPNKFCQDDYDEYKCKANPIDDIGMNFSVPLGNAVVYARTNWLTQINREDGTSETSKKNYSIGITGGDKFFWEAELNFSDLNSSIYDSYIDTSDSYINLTLYYRLTNLTIIEPDFQFNLGYMALHNNRAKLIIGLNNKFSYQFFKTESEIKVYYLDYIFSQAAPEEYKITGKSYNLRFYTYPNILAEVILTKHLLVFAGARYGINFYGAGIYGDDKLLHFFDISNSGTNAYLGLRYEYENFAIEARLQNNVFGEIFEKKNPFINLSGFFYF